MYKYTSIDDCNDFLLSLNLIKCRDMKKYIKTIYAIGNNVENNYKVYKIKKKIMVIERYMHQIRL